MVTKFRLSETIGLIVLLDSLFFRHVPEVLFKLSRSFYNGLLLWTLNVVVRSLCVRAGRLLRRCVKLVVFLLLPVRAVFFLRYNCAGIGRSTTKASDLIVRTAFWQYSHGLSVLGLRPLELYRCQFISSCFWFQRIIVPVRVVSQQCLRLLGWLDLDGRAIGLRLHLGGGLLFVLPLDVV